MIWESRFALPAGILVAFVLPWLAGWLATVHLAVPVGPGARAALGLPMGIALVGVLLGPALLLLHAEVAAYAVLAALVAIVAAGIIGLPRRAAAEPRRHGNQDPVELSLAAAVCLLVASLAVPALGWPPSRTDAIARWAVKGKHLAAHGFDHGYFAQESGETYLSPDDPPLLPLQLAWIGLAFGGWSEGGMRTWPLLLLLAFAAFSAAHLKERGVSGRMAWLILALFAASPGLVPSAIEPDPDLPAGILAALSVALLQVAWAAPDPRASLAAGILAGLVGVSAPEGRAAVPVLCAVAAISAWRARRAWRRAGASLVAFVVPALLLPVAWGVLLMSHDVPHRPEAAIEPMQPGTILPSVGRIAGSFVHHALFSGSVTGRPDDWLLLLPVLVVAIAARPESLRAERCGAFLGSAGGLLAANVATLLSSPAPLEWLLETRVRGLTLALAPLLLLALGTCLAPPQARTAAPSGEWPGNPP